LNQPAVVGEILAGVLLGPSLLSGFVPAFGAFFLPQTPVQGHLLEVAALFGALFLLLITGLEMDVALIRRHARTAMGVSLGGILITFTTGFILGLRLPRDLIGTSADRIVFALFLATAMSISAIPVLAKVLLDLKLMRRDIGQTMIAAGMSDDTIGWILLSIVAGLAAGTSVSFGSIASIVVSLALFMVLSFTAGRWLVRRLLELVQHRIGAENRFLTVTVVLMFAWGALASSLHFEPVLGAFVIGIVLGQMRSIPEDTVRSLHSVALGIFAPIFFGVAGLKVDAMKLIQPRLALVALIVIAVATIGKVVGTFAGARLIGRKDPWTSLSFGAGLNARGAMEIIVASIGLSLGILSQEMFSVIVVMAIATSLMAPPALRWVLQRVELSPDEVERLRQEEIAAGSFVSSIHRVLLPIRYRETISDQYVAEAKVLERLAKRNELAVTLLTASKPGARNEGVEFLGRVRELFTGGAFTQKIVEGTSPSELILDEANRGYDLMILGATQDSNTRVLFNPMVDYLTRVSPCPTMVIKSYPMPPHWQLRRILVPTNGAAPARRAAELAFALASPDDEVVILNVAAPDTSALDADGSGFRRQMNSAHGIVDELRMLGEAQKVKVAAEVRVGPSPEAAILELASERKIDLILLGTDVRPGSSRLFLGPRVERILNNAPCPVVVVNA
ncbi:MAG TPA: cation:proton antiporter, partial [Thermoanaerobaculia bacterium]|nr:cation:proton antiporter [Thermoanaerobaculia bacterium]